MVLSKTQILRLRKKNFRVLVEDLIFNKISFIHYSFIMKILVALIIIFFIIYIYIYQFFYIVGSI